MAGKLYHVNNFTPGRVQGKSYRWDFGAVRKLDERNGGWLRPLNLRLVEVREIPLVTEIRNLKGAGRGLIQDELGDDLLLTGAVSALAPTVHGQNGIGLGPGNDPSIKIVRKRAIDRAAAAIQGMAFDVIAQQRSDVLFSVDASEGGRSKPGEAGANPATYLGQLFGERGLTAQPIENLRRDPAVNVLGIVIDCVDKTGATAEGGYSAVTSFVVTTSVAKAIPDLRFIKLISGWGFGDSVITDVEAEPEVVVRALARAADVTVEKLNAFQLVRPDRLDKIMEIYRALGVNFLRDQDGDVMPGIAAGLRVYPLENGKPLHAQIGAGGAAEGGMMVVVDWLGGKALLRFASSAKFKSWETRYALTDDERETVIRADFDSSRTITMKDIYQNPFADGIGVFGGISDNRLIPDLWGAEVGTNMAEAHVLSITPQGFANIRAFTFDFEDGNRQTTVGRLTPLISQLRDLGDVRRIEDTVKSWMKSRVRKARLEREWRQDYYLCLDWKGEVHVLDGETFASLMTGKEPRFDERDRAILSALGKHTDWVTQAPQISVHHTFVDMGRFAQKEAKHPAVLQEFMEE